ncbi:MAG: hypothetical protein AB7I59_03760 [Geminicoccaceae bacterium]
MTGLPASERVRIRGCRTLADDWHVLRRYRFDHRRTDGTWQELTREAYDRGNGAAILLYNRALLPCFLGDADPELERLVPPPPELAEDIHLLVHRDLRGLPRVRAVAPGLTRLLHERDARLAGLGGPHRQAGRGPPLGRSSAHGPLPDPVAFSMSPW